MPPYTEFYRFLQVFGEVQSELGDSEGVWLYPKHISLSTLSSKHSRHTTPSAAHHVMDAVSKHLGKTGDASVVVGKQLYEKLNSFN